MHVNKHVGMHGHAKRLCADWKPYLLRSHVDGVTSMGCTLATPLPRPQTEEGAQQGF